MFGNARATDDTLLLRVMMKLLDDRQRADELMRNLKNDVMIFNKDGQGAKELRELTANYYANNDFTKVIGEIELATEELAQLVGSKVIELAESYYLNPEKEGTDTGIVRKVQRPIALLATLRLYQKNDLSHEDDGRKFKVATDGSENCPGSGSWTVMTRCISKNTTRRWMC